MCGVVMQNCVLQLGEMIGSTLNVEEKAGLGLLA